jgi:chaperonin GroES
MNAQPLYDRLLAKRINEEEVLPGGIVIPDTAKEKSQKANVVAVGTGRRTKDGKKIPLDVQVGDRILFGGYSGTEVVIDGDEFLILREDDVLAILKPASEGVKAA